MLILFIFAIILGLVGRNPSERVEDFVNGEPLWHAVNLFGYRGLDKAIKRAKKLEAKDRKEELRNQFTVRWP